MGAISRKQTYTLQKNKDSILSEVAIYYKYRAETKEIEFPELKNLLDKEKEKEKNLWMQHIHKIAQIGPQNVNLLILIKEKFLLEMVKFY